MDANAVLSAASPVVKTGVALTEAMVASGVCPVTPERFSFEVKDRVTMSPGLAKSGLSPLETIDIGLIEGATLSMVILLVFAVTVLVFPVRSVIVNAYVTGSLSSLPVN